jgi:hypothetical protein
MEHDVVTRVVALLETSVTLNARAIHATFFAFPNDLVLFENSAADKRFQGILV